MRRRFIALWTAAFALLGGTAYAATRMASSSCCPSCPFCG